MRSNQPGDSSRFVLQLVLSRAHRANDDLLRLVQVVDEIVGEVEMGLYQRGRCQGEPLAERDVLELVCGARYQYQ